MAITIGSRLGPYEIIAPIGAGGMGEVWRGRDTRLDRSVAIKVLPAALAHDAQLRLRFEREAKTISQLNHPHICTLYDVGDDYLVMELIEGESLSERLVRGPLPMEDVFRYGVQIAEALDRAHRAGVVHRDLKPGNVMIARSGAKLLDFGLARSTVIEISTDSATHHRPLTQEGTIVGTFQYMSPEQLEGTEADARSDLFAFGALLYEMATGKRAFDGKTKTSLIAAIVKEQPRPIAELQPLTPPALQHVIDKCLAKDPEERWQSAHDVASELKWISGAGSQAGIAPAVASGRSRSRRSMAVAAIVASLVAIAAVVAAGMLATRLRDARPLTRLEIAQTLQPVADGAPLAVSPDGRQLAAIVPIGNTTRLWLRDLGSGEGKMLAGTDGASYPFWSPDGHGIGFFAGGKLKTIGPDSGAVQTLADAPLARGGAWSSGGVIVFAPTAGGPLFKVSENGGTPVPVTKVVGPGQTDRNPLFTGDGTHFLYVSAGPKDGDESIRLGSVDGNGNGGVNRKVLEYGSTAVLAGDTLLTVRGGNLFAQRFDGRKLAVTGKPVALAEHVDWYGPKFNAAFGVGGSTLVYERAALPRQQLLVADGDTSTPVPTGEVGWYAAPHLSPDGKRFVVTRWDSVDQGADLWLQDVGATAGARLTYAKNASVDLIIGSFSPDGKTLGISIQDSSGTTKTWLQPAGGGTQQPLRTTSPYAHIADWTADGKTLLIIAQEDTLTMNVDGTNPVPLHFPSALQGRDAKLSPDQRWVAYDSNKTGRNEIYVTNYPSCTADWQVSTAGGQIPYWSNDGRKLYFLGSDARISAVNVRAGETFSADTPQPLPAPGDHITDYALARNGRMLIVRELDPGKPPMSVVLNWQKLLDR